MRKQTSENHNSLISAIRQALHEGSVKPPEVHLFRQNCLRRMALRAPRRSADCDPGREENESEYRKGAR